MSGPRSSIEWQFRADDALDALRMRAVVRAFLVAEADESSDVDGAVLVFGELVANVVRHAPGAISVRIEWPAAGLGGALRGRLGTGRTRGLPLRGSDGARTAGGSRSSARWRANFTSSARRSAART